MTDATTTFGIVAALLLLTLSVVAFYLVFNRIRLRKRKLELELGTAPGVVNDRAFNKIRIGRTEMEILERSGVDVSRVEALLDQAQKRYDLGDFGEALSLASTAHESIVALRRQGPTRLPSVRDLRPVSRDSVPSPRLNAASATEPESPSPLPVQRMAKNRAESHFQMTLLAEDIGKLQGAHQSAPGLDASLGLQHQAQSAYASGDYTEALRIALKGRRTLGGQLETVPPPRAFAAHPGGDRPVGPTDPGSRTVPTVEGESSTPCPQCGQPTRTSDRFCRACGAPRALGKCPRCGIPSTPGDTFCGSCGSPLT